MNGPIDLEAMIGGVELRNGFVLTLLDETIWAMEELESLKGKSGATGIWEHNAERLQNLVGMARRFADEARSGLKECRDASSAGPVIVAERRARQ